MSTTTDLRDTVQARAACRGEDTDLWFPENWEDPTPALLTCARCPVREQCLQLALALGTDAEYGIWGGTTETERHRRRRVELRSRQVTSVSLAAPDSTPRARRARRASAEEAA